jgi:hypothetical protein
MANLIPLTLEKLMVALRDGRKLIGVLRSWDQFGTSPPLPPPTPLSDNYAQQTSSSNPQSSASSFPHPLPPRKPTLQLPHNQDSTPTYPKAFS